MAVSFSGGMKLKTYKSLTANAPLRALRSCDEHIFPLLQHKGAPIAPIVSIGDNVRVGQKIADAEDYFAVPIHSSVSGIVTDISDTAITIENNGQYNAVTTPEAVDAQKYTTRELLWLIRDAGVVEPDGEPAHIKLSQPVSVKFVIANCAESDLYVTSKQKLVNNYAAEIIKGLKIAMRILNVKEGYIGVEADMQGAFNKLKKELRYDMSIHLLKLRAKYPQSDEAQIIKAVTGLDTPVGSVVLDAVTLYDIARAVYDRKNVTERIVTVSGEYIRTPSVFTVPIGAPVSSLIQSAGRLTNDSAGIVIGGGIKGADTDISAPVVKNTDAVLALPMKKASKKDADCGLCRKCVRKCPMRISPRLLSNTDDIKKAEDNFVLDCTECGLCSYICPKRRNPMEKIITLKNKKAGS